MAKNVMLIDAQGVKDLGYVHKNVLPHVISVTIRRVQEVMLKKVLGKKKYLELLEKVAASLPPTDPLVPLDEATKELLEDYVQPYLVACVDYRIIFPLTHRARSKSVGSGVDENHTASDTNDLIKLKDQMRSDVDAYAEAIKEFLLGSQDCDTPTKSNQAVSPAIRFR
jgi:hypothetical protein